MVPGYKLSAHFVTLFFYVRKKFTDINVGSLHDIRVSFHPGGGSTPLCGLNGDVRPDRVWFSGCFVLNGVSISSLSVLNRVSLHDLMA